MIKSVLALVFTLSAPIVAMAASPFSYATYGKYAYRSELYNVQELVVARARGVLRVSPLRNGGLKISISDADRDLEIYFYGDHRYKLVEEKSDKLVQNRRGRWGQKNGTGPIKARSRDTISGDRSVSDFGLSRVMAVFNLRPSPGYREKYIARPAR